MPPSARADAAASSPSPLCRPPCSAAPASRLLLPPFGFQRSGRRQQFGFSKYNLWHSCDRGSYPGISAAPPIPAGVVSRYPPPPSPPTAALFFCLRPLFPLGLISCAYPHPPNPQFGPLLLSLPEYLGALEFSESELGGGVGVGAGGTGKRSRYLGRSFSVHRGLEEHSFSYSNVCLLAVLPRELPSALNSSSLF